MLKKTLFLVCFLICACQTGLPTNIPSPNEPVPEALEESNLPDLLDTSQSSPLPITSALPALSTMISSLSKMPENWAVSEPSGEVLLVSKVENSLANVNLEALNNLLALDKNVFQPGETISLQYKTQNQLESEAFWALMVPADIPHGNAQLNESQALSKQGLLTTKGSVDFQAPDTPGIYSFRLQKMLPDAPGEHLSTLHFVVEGQVPKGTIRILNESTQIPLGYYVQYFYQMEGRLDDSAWIGIVPASTPRGSESTNDQHDLVYQSLSQDIGSGALLVPDVPGQYELRLHTSDDESGQEVAVAAFEVTTASDLNPNRFSVDQIHPLRSETIKVAYTIPDRVDDTAWIGFVPSHIPHGDEALNDQHDVSYMPLGQDQGIVEITAPDTLGDYELRMFTSDDPAKAREVASLAVQMVSYRFSVSVVSDGKLDKTRW